MLWLSRLEEKTVSPRNGSNAAARNNKVSLVRKLGGLPEIAVYLSFWEKEESQGSIFFERAFPPRRNTNYSAVSRAISR